MKKGLTNEQRVAIESLLTNEVWDKILETILTEHQKNSHDEMKMIAFDMEEVLQKVAAHFGLAGMSPQ